jgi:hypothetical protein
MANENQRIGAFIAALEKVREYVAGLDDNDEVDTATYNRWMGMLDGVVEGNWKSLSLPDDIITAAEMAMHIDAAIAFLEQHRLG